MQDNENTGFLREVGEKLCAVRKSKKLTQSQTAQAVGTTQSCISDIENGKKQGCLNLIIKLIRFYGVSYELILGESGNSHYTFPQYSGEIPDDGGMELLSALVAGSGGSRLSEQLSETVRVCIYMLFRKVYGQNPYNSEKIFSLGSDEASELCLRFLENSSAELDKCFEKSKVIKKRLELPVEKSGDLRRFVKSCEQILIGGQSSEKADD